jgi:hypothetical protein
LSPDPAQFIEASLEKRITSVLPATQRRSHPGSSRGRAP